LEERAERRAPVLVAIAERLVAEEAIPADRVVLLGKRVPIATAAYMILNDTYKRWRIQDGHWTEPPKIAALQAMAIMTILPFRPLYPDYVQTIAEARCNEVFAATVASAILGTDVVEGKSVNFGARLLDMLSECRSETLEAYVTDLNEGIDSPLEHYVRSVHAADRFKINALVTIFELASGEKR